MWLAASTAVALLCARAAGKVAGSLSTIVALLAPGLGLLALTLTNFPAGVAGTTFVAWGAAPAAVADSPLTRAFAWMCWLAASPLAAAALTARSLGLPASQTLRSAMECARDGGYATTALFGVYVPALVSAAGCLLASKPKPKAD